MPINVMRIGKHIIAVAAVIQHNVYKSVTTIFLLLIESKELCLTVMSIMTPQNMLMVKAVIMMKFQAVELEYGFYVVHTENVVTY